MTSTPRTGQSDAESDAASPFAGAGEMRARCRALDWTTTPLGATEQWPPSLCTAASTVLGMGFPCILLWGPQLIQIYNDGYTSILGDKHPRGLGMPTRECWPEVWHINGPVYEQVFAGETVTFHDQLYPLLRHGPDAPPDDVYLAISYGPVRDEAGNVGGVLITMFDTTARVIAQRLEAERTRLQLSLDVERARLADIIRVAPAFIAVLHGPTHVITLTNTLYDALIGGRHVIGRSVAEALPEAAAQGFITLLDGVLATGEPFIGREVPYRRPDAAGVEDERYVDLVYQPLEEADGTRSGIFVHGVDVTEQVRARRAVENLLEKSNETQLALEDANAQLEEQQLELESSNQQLQDNSAELEAANEELQATTEELMERTTAAEKSAAELAESEARYRLAIDAAQLGTWSWDLATDVATFDARVRELMAFESDAESRLDILATRIHPDDRDRVNAALGEAANTTGDGRYVTECRIVRPDGSERLIVSSGVMSFVGDGESRRPLALIGTILDVTESKRAEAALEASERQWRTLADAIPTLAWTARPDGYIDWYNARWYEYTGTTAEQMAGWGWQSVHDPVELPWVMETWQAGIATGEPVEMTFPLKGADGRFRAFLTRIIPLKDGDGQVVRWFGTNTDVESERSAREAAESANRAKSDFLATMSHELRTPLNAIAGYAELLEIGVHGPLTDEQLGPISRIQRSQRHLLGLINDVLNFAKLEAGRVEYDVADFSVANVVDVLEPLVAPQLRTRSLRYDRLACNDETCIARADAEKLQQVLLNLLSNAIKFTPAGGAVTVRCMTRGDDVAIEVEDTGIGIAVDRHDQVFPPFVQIDRRLNAPHEGTGLGLAISRDLARAMGGDLTFTSVPGKGSTFTVTLPRGGA